MSEDQLEALLAKLKQDANLLKKIRAAADLDAALALVNEAGFNVDKVDWLKYQSQQTSALSDQELEVLAGGTDCLDSNETNGQTCGVSAVFACDTQGDCNTASYGCDGNG